MCAQQAQEVCAGADIVQQNGAAVLGGDVELCGQAVALLPPLGFVCRVQVVQAGFAEHGLRVAAQQVLQSLYVVCAAFFGGKPGVDAEGGDDVRRGQCGNCRPVGAAGGGDEEAGYACGCGGGEDLRQLPGQRGGGKVGVGVGEHGGVGGRWVFGKAAVLGFAAGGFRLRRRGIFRRPFLYKG